ncbi:unnamed protein product [Amaranthus hypochondriacus]
MANYKTFRPNSLIPSISILNVIFFLITSSSTSSASDFWWNYCPDNTTNRFVRNSDYEANLNTLFDYLTTNSTNPSGYHQASVNNTVYGHFQCRNDLPTSTCQDCVATVIYGGVPQYCPNQKLAILWYSQCLVRYSHKSFFGQVDKKLEFVLNNEDDITGNVTHFDEVLVNMMHNVIAVRAANGGHKKFAAYSADFTTKETIYGMGQCTSDLSPTDCKLCLMLGFDAEESYKRGAKFFNPSCILRYEMYPFFDLSLLASPPPSLPPLPPPSPPPPPQHLLLRPPPSITSEKRKTSTKTMIFIIVIPIMALILAFLAIAIGYSRYQNSKKRQFFVEAGLDFTGAEIFQCDFVTLQAATNNFSDENKLGEGGFGGVYKGTLSNGQQIAVKRLSMNSSQGFEQFKNEISLVAKLHHRNLVRVLGFCFEGSEKQLVYEYVPNKSLDIFLFDSQELLDWKTRYKVIKGIARGMLYLHHDSQLKVIHRDLKASNVLLDADMNPKISDFGLAKIFGMDQSQGNTSRIVGTYGYMSPEYAMHGEFSIKSDVYSFGVLVLEIVSGRRNNTFYQSGDTEDLLYFAWKKWRYGMVIEFIDETIRGSCSHDEVMRCIHLGLLCVQESAEDRPSMSTIVLTLDSYSVTLPIPEGPGFSIRSRGKSSFTKDATSNSNNSSSNSAPLSVNDVSITDPEPR